MLLGRNKPTGKKWQVLLWLLYAASSSGQVVSGDTIARPLNVKYSGEQSVWTATGSGTDTGDYAELEVTERVTGQIVLVDFADYNNLLAVFNFDLPRVGLYDGRARSCNNGTEPQIERCSDWITSNNLIFAVLAPPGPPVLE